MRAAYRLELSSDIKKVRYKVALVLAPFGQTVLDLDQGGVPSLSATQAVHKG